MSIRYIFFLVIANPIFAMQGPMVHIQKAEDAAQFAGQVVAYTPAYFLCDRYTYKELKGPLDPSLRYAFLSHAAVHHPKYNRMPVTERDKLEKGYHLSPLITADVIFMNNVLLTEWLQKDKLLMRKITPKEAARLLQILREKKAHFESYSFKDMQEMLNQLISKS